MSRTKKFVKIPKEQIKHRPIHVKADKSYIQEMNATSKNMLLNNHQR